MDMPLSYCICFFILSFSVTGESIFTEEQTTQIKEIIQTAMRCTKIPGLSLAVVKGEETWTEGYGVSDVSSGRAVTSSTLFGVGSITKAFTVSLLSMFLDKSSSFSWETPIVDILGEDFRLGDDYVTSHVTLKDLLTHRTGLCASILKIYTGGPHNMTLRLFEKRLRYLPIAAPFRDQHVYNDFMYVLAGRITEVMGGASWEELLRTRLLQPMNMKQTKVLDPGLLGQPNELSTTYMEAGEELIAVDPSVYTDLSPYQSSGGLVTSADDMMQWMHVLLHQGVAKDGTRVLSESNIRTMQTAKAVVPENTATLLYKPEFPESYSTSAMDLLGYPVVHHPGGLLGFTSLLIFIHDLDLGVFIATNGPGYDQAFKAINAIFFYITDLLLGLKPWLSPSNVCHVLQHWINITRPYFAPRAYQGVVLGDRGWSDAEVYLGSYGNMLVGDLIINKDASGDGLTMMLNHLHGRLYRTANESVLVARSLGVRRFATFGVDGTQLFMILKFLQADHDGRYQELLFTFPGDSQEWSFRRGVQFDSDL